MSGSSLATRLCGVLLAVMLAALSVAAVCSMPLRAYADDGVTRGQWVHELVETFAHAADDDDLIDEGYFSDLAENSEYYRDFLYALELGIIDEPVGGKLRADESATREFAAHTLNHCLGYPMMAGAYTFADSAACSYSDDDQVALSRGWFSLIDGKFMPSLAITAAESGKAISDAKAAVASMALGDDHENHVVLAAGVKEIPADTDAYWVGEDGLWVRKLPISIEKGDKFVAYHSGMPNAYVAQSVSGEVGGDSPRLKWRGQMMPRRSPRSITRALFP